MPDEQYCKPCERFLRGEAYITHQRRTCVVFIHHPNAESFNNALKLPCSICSLAWEGRLFSLPSRSGITSGTTGTFGKDVGNDISDARLLQFGLSQSDHRSSTIVIVPWRSMFSSDHGYVHSNGRPVGMIDHQYPSLLSHNTRSASALSFLLSKYRECHDKHVGCGLQQSPAVFYPSKILDVGVSHHSPIYLLETRGSGNKGPYVCLSHCWGLTIPFTLTKRTHSTLANGLPVSALPKTFQDAIFVARSLCIQYLWIDSLYVDVHLLTNLANC